MVEMASERTLLMEAEHARTLLKAAVANQEPRGIRVRDRRLRGKARRVRNSREKPDSSLGGQA